MAIGAMEISGMEMGADFSLRSDEGSGCPRQEQLAWNRWRVSALLLCGLAWRCRKRPSLLLAAGKGWENTFIQTLLDPTCMTNSPSQRSSYVTQTEG